MKKLILVAKKRRRKKKKKVCLLRSPELIKQLLEIWKKLSTKVWGGWLITTPLWLRVLAIKKPHLQFWEMFLQSKSSFFQLFFFPSFLNVIGPKSPSSCTLKYAMNISFFWALFIYFVQPLFQMFFDRNELVPENLIYFPCVHFACSTTDQPVCRVQ